MKKFYSFLFAAVALVGFAACNSDSTEEPAPAGAEKLSFKANIDTTKTDLEGLQTVWCEGDVVMIEGFTFVCEKDATTFTCEQSGCSALLEMDKVRAVYSSNGDGKVDSAAGTMGAVLEATGNLAGGELLFQIKNAFLKFTTTGTVTLKGAGLFYYPGIPSTDELEVDAGEHYVAINPSDGEIEFSYEVDGIVGKSTTITFEKKKIYNLGVLEIPIFKVYVIPQPGTAYAQWEKVNLYTWVEDSIGLEWPGQDITANTEVINGYTYNYFEYPAEYIGQTVNVIVNNGTDQTGDIELGVLNTNYYVVYSPIIETQVYTTAPAAGSIEEYVAPENLDPKPDTVTLYLKTTWGWTNWALYAWGGNGTWGDFNKWPGKAKEYDQVIEGETYKAWDIPASCVGQTGIQVIVTGKEWGETKQTKDTPVTFTAGKDVFVEITGWDGNAGKANLTVINGPY